MCLNKSHLVLVLFLILATSLIACGGSSGTEPNSNPINNQAPQISGIPSTQVIVEADYLFAPVGSDVDGDTLSFEIENKPLWANFDSATGTLSGTPSTSDINTTSNIIIKVSDGTLITALSAFDLTVSYGSATLSWEPPTERTDDTTFPLNEVAGYRIYYGNQQDQMQMLTDINDSSISEYVVGSLTAGSHYFAVTTYDIHNTESSLSNVQSKIFE